MQQALAVIIGILGTIALSGTMSFTAEKVAYTNSTTSCLLGAFAVCILLHVYKNIETTDKRGRIISGLYSLGLSIALTAGKQLQTVENFAIGNPVLWLRIAVLTIFFWGLVWYVLQWMNRKMLAEGRSLPEDSKEKAIEDKNTEEDDRTYKKRAFLMAWLIIFLCWIPVFLAFYPGAFVYDAQDEYVQVVTRTFTTHHPLSHVLLLGGFVCFGNKFFGSFNIGIAMYTIFQMLVLSGVFAYTISCLITKVPKKWYVTTTLFYGLFPVIPMYAVCSAKDTLFNGAFLIMLVQILKLSEKLFTEQTGCLEGNKELKTIIKALKWDIILLIVATTAMMLLRNNGVYVVLTVMAISVIVAIIKKSSRKGLFTLAVCFVAGLLLYTTVDKTLTFVLKADDSESQELLTVPIQQLTRTYKYSPEVFSEEEKEILFSYIPEDILQIYDADLSDLVKAHFDNERYSQNPGEFMSLWIRTFAKKPVTYVNAWLMTSYGYWYPDTVINVYGGQQRFTFQYGDSSYFGFETEQPGERDSKFPWLEEQYRKMSLKLYQQNVPVISMLFSPGFLFWVFMGSIALCFYQKRYPWLLVLGSIFLLWGTAILGPTFLVRYVLILWFALPLWSVLYYYDCGKVFSQDKR